MTEIKEILFSETDGSCAYCGIKDYRVLTIHHIVQEDPKNESYDNKILLCHNCHQMHHQNKGPSIDDLYDIKKRLIYKTLTQQGVNALKEAYRKGFVLAAPYLLNHIIELRYLRFKESHITYDSDDHIISGIYELTKEGKQFAERWGFN